MSRCLEPTDAEIDTESFAFGSSIVQFGWPVKTKLCQVEIVMGLSAARFCTGRRGPSVQ